MRFDALHLTAFGPFTDRTLDLGAGRHGLHVLFGRNEAGKSSALRGVRALLFGVPERTADTFLHDNRALRVGAVIRPAGGEPFTCVRRKGRKDTLLDAAGAPLDESALGALLEGVDEGRFRMLFGIDHGSLLAGGEELLAERGREAEALFGSGLGSHAVHRVLEQLDREAQDLFAPRGQRPQLNKALRELDEVRRRGREATLSANRWDEARRGRDRARGARDEAEGALRVARERLRALERLRRTLPGLAALREYEQRRAALGAAPDLPDDFAARRRDAIDGLRSGTEAQDRADARLAALDAEMEGLPLVQGLLDEAEAIDDLHARLGAQRTALAERPALEAERQRVARALADCRAALQVADTDDDAGRRALLAQLSYRGRAEELARLHAAREQGVDELEQRVAACARERDRMQRELAALPAPEDAPDLRDALRAARAAGDLDERVASLAQHHASAQRACARALAALGRWPGTVEALQAAPLPEEGALRDFQARFQQLAADERRTGDAARLDGEHLQQARETLRALELAGTVPSEGALAEVRARRERGWVVVQGRWRGAASAPGEVVAYTGGDDGDDALAAAYAAAVAGADDVADRLRREAQRVHERAASMARCERLQEALDGHAAASDRAAAARAALERQWEACWAPCGVQPGPVDAMVDWRQSALRLREQAAAMQSLHAELAASGARLHATRSRLLEALGSVGSGQNGGDDGGMDDGGQGGPADGVDGGAVASPEGGSGRGARAAAGDERVFAPAPALAEVLARAESRVERMQAQALEREALAKDLARMTADHAQVTADLERALGARAEWRHAWAALGNQLGLTRALSPGELSDHFARVQELSALGEEHSKLSARIDAVDREAAGFAADASAVSRRVAPELESLPAAERVPRLHAMLREQQRIAVTLADRRKQAAALRDERDAARARQASAGAALRVLCEQAGGVPQDALEDVERRDREHRELRDSWRKARGDLLAQGDGESVEQLAAAAAGASADVVQAELQQIEGDIEESLEPARQARARECFAAERDFEEMRGSADAAELEFDAQQLVATVRDQAARYVRLRLAARVLRDQIDRFRREHRDPILAAAGRYFQTLTGGGFASVDTDFDAADEPVLVAVRDAGEHLTVDALSTGTRDQLYLALRLATLNHYLDRAQPLPFIVDDILVQFDDDRTRSTLRTLAHFSRRTQVLMFTHHARVAEDARSMAEEGGGVFVHEL